MTTHITLWWVQNYEVVIITAQTLKSLMFYIKVGVNNQSAIYIRNFSYGAYYWISHWTCNMEQKNQFYNLLDDHISKLNKNKKSKFVIDQETYDKVLSALLLPKGSKCPDGASFKFWSNQHFKTEQIGENQLVYCKKKSCPVTTKNNIFNTIFQCHQRVGHSGHTRTYDEVKSNYSWIPRVAIELFLQTCQGCQVRVPLKKPKSAKPIISLGFLTWVQADLIDMTSRPDGEMKWILHVRDHFTKYSWTFPLTSKRAVEVAEKLTTLFCMFGPPHILQEISWRFTSN